MSIRIGPVAPEEQDSPLQTMYCWILWSLPLLTLTVISHLTSLDVAGMM